MSVIDISRVLSSETAVWPGDRLPAFTWTMQQSSGHSVNVGAACLSLHSGTHVDAPLHYVADGPSVDALPLEPFVGPATVVDVGAAQLIQPHHLESVTSSLEPRVLFKTPHSRVPVSEWRDDFPAIAADTIRWLGERGVLLVGTDAPSLDAPDSKTLPAHHALRTFNMMNLEHLNLRDVAPGSYQLVALPLCLKGMDASPVRAVLIRQ